MKTLLRTNYVELLLVKAFVLGVGKTDDTYAIFLGCIVIDIKPWMFKRKPRPKAFNEI